LGAPIQPYVGRKSAPETNRGFSRLSELTRSDEVPTNRLSGKAAVPGGFDRRGAEQIVDTWRSAEFDSIELHRGSAITQEYPRHWHDELYLCATVAGRRELDCMGLSYITPPGSLVLIPPGEIHADRKFECTFRCMFIELRAFHIALENFAEQSVRGINFRTALIQNERTMTSFLQVHRSLEERSSEPGRDSTVLRFLRKLISEHSGSISPLRDGNEDFAVRRTKQYLDERYSERVSLQDLARLTRLSPYHLHRAFCKRIGMPPHAYQLQVRITQARLLLRMGRSISDTAFLVGFVDQSHFSRHFKKLMGVTPGRYSRPQQECTRRPAS
jgi:AraC-like DNA-binding protein